MKAICLEKLKQIELDILIYIDQVCKENNLRYFLCGGTLLGAIRHKGFIPWDDDIDICMPRPDYDRLIEILRDTNNKYRILSPKQEKYYYNFSKVVDSETILYEYNYQPIENMGVYIDIFPLEGMPTDDFECKKHFNVLNKLRKRINSFAWLKPRIGKNLINYVKRLTLYNQNKKISISQFQKKYESIAKQYNYDKSEYVYATGGAYGSKDIFLREFFSRGLNVEFEGNFFTAPSSWDLYLTQLYGDYMQLPPIDKRVSNHNYKAVYK